MAEIVPYSSERFRAGAEPLRDLTATATTTTSRSPAACGA